MIMGPPEHHKEIAQFLKKEIDGGAKITAFRDNNNSNPIPIGEFGSGKYKLFSTIGAFDMNLNLPIGNFEFASYGELSWLPNAIASSIYWLRDREFNELPIVCEDVVKHNAKSTYRHMAYMPSTFSLKISTGQKIFWLLGVPITDKEISLSSEEVINKANTIYPGWLFNEGT
jgi:hypothetical protein